MAGRAADMSKAPLQEVADQLGDLVASALQQEVPAPPRDPEATGHPHPAAPLRYQAEAQTTASGSARTAFWAASDTSSRVTLLLEAFRPTTHAVDGQPRPSSASTSTSVCRSASRPPAARGTVSANSPAARTAATLSGAGVNSRSVRAAFASSVSLVGQSQSHRHNHRAEVRLDRKSISGKSACANRTMDEKSWPAPGRAMCCMASGRRKFGVEPESGRTRERTRCCPDQRGKEALRVRRHASSRAAFRSSPAFSRNSPSSSDTMPRASVSSARPCSVSSSRARCP